MNLDQAAICKAILNQNAETKANIIAKYRLKLDEDKFEVSKASPDRITKAIRKIVKNEIKKQTTNKETVFLIDLSEMPNRRELSPAPRTQGLNLRDRYFQRRALSPNNKDTYIVLNNFNIKNDRYIQILI